MLFNYCLLFPVLLVQWYPCVVGDLGSSAAQSCAKGDANGWCADCLLGHQRIKNAGSL